MEQMRLVLGLLAVLLAACGMTDEKTVIEDITPASAATAKIDAEFKVARIPESFTAIKAVKGHTTWGTTTLSYSAGYSGAEAAIRSFLDVAHARQDFIVYRNTDGCPPATPGGPDTVAPTAMITLWMGKGVFDRCATIESWYLPNSELTHDRATAGMYRTYNSPGTGGDERANIVISVSMPGSSQG